MMRLLLAAAVHAGFFCWTKYFISKPEALNGIPKRGLRFMKALVSSLILWWSLIAVFSLLAMASLNLGVGDQKWLSQFVAVVPLAGCFLAIVHVSQLLKLRAMHDAAIPAGSAELDTSDRFEELLREFGSDPSSGNLEALLREIGPPPRMFGARNRRKWREQWGDLGL
jgi:hypothetical protein